MAQSRRVFVGNLPHEVTEDELVSKFKKYGTVESVDIKCKKDPSSGETLSTFSFVNLRANEESLGKCVYLLNGIKLGGRNITVEAAKESFLQRLQRERELSQKPAISQPSSTSAPPKSLDSVPKSSLKEKEKKRLKKEPVKKDSSSSESSDSEDDKDTYHPCSKLPMFKGITSFSSEATSKCTPSSDASKIDAGNKINFSTRNPVKSQFSSGTSDILKKFESFSDVWKDDDEPPNKRESFGSNHSSRMGQRQGFDSSFNRNAFEAESNGSRQQRQPLQSENKRNNRQEASTGSVSIAEEKRLKSLDAKREAFEQQKKAVKLALSDKNAPRVNQKIVFGDDDDDNASNYIQQKPLSKQNLKPKAASTGEEKQKTLTLFDESDDESAADWKKEFQVKRQFEGAKGRKLLELQSTYNNDDRFKLDERFYDNQGETISETPSKPVLISQQSEEGVENVEAIEGVDAEERGQQLQILSSILGQPLHTALPPAHHERKPQGMLRFDPSKPNHSKFELSKEPKEKKKKRKRGEDDEENEDEDESIVKSKVRREEKDPEPVSQNKFYSVSDSLADALKQSKEGQGSGFSLLQMFGPSTGLPENKKKDIEVPRKLLSSKEGLKNRPLVDDSSSEEEQEQDEKGPTATAKPVSVPGIVSSHGVWQESFFLQPDDNRLKEGASFFSKSDDTYDANFPKRREALKKFISRKYHDDWNRESARKRGSFQKKASSNKSLSQRPRKKQRQRQRR